ncbi:MAG: InlB B-repeat-containing protein [Alphaproteobacteria bacterium]
MQRLCRLFVCIFTTLCCLWVFFATQDAMAAITNPEFTITTTNIPAGGTFSFNGKAKGSLQIDWGDGTATQTINKPNGTISHTYNKAGEYIIGMTGELEDLGGTVISFANNQYIKTLGGSVTGLFNLPKATSLSFSTSFENCSNLTTIPDTLFTGYSGSATKFANTFSGCSNLQYFETDDGLVNFVPDTMADLNFGNNTFSGTSVATECPPGTTPLNAMVATCTPNPYTIAYVMNGGTNFANAPTEYLGGIETIISGTPTRSDYAFVGWCDDAELTQNCSPTKTITTMDYGNKTFYAKWAYNRAYTITYVMNGGTLFANAPTEYWFGTEVIIDGTPTNAGLQFMGWCEDVELTLNCTTTKIISTTDIDDKVFYAKWGCNAGYAIENDQCVICAENKWCFDSISYDCPTGATSQPGASSLSDCSCATGYHLSDNECVANIINVTWKPENGENDVVNQCSYNGDIILPTTPTKRGHTFTGWKLVSADSGDLT